MQLRILTQASLKARIVSNSGYSLEVTGHSTTTSETKVDMSIVPKDYHDFTDIFSKSKASKLADHRPYDLKITLDEALPCPTV